MSDLTVAEVLERAADILNSKGAWAQGRYAVADTGKGCASLDERAVRWCAIGAMGKASGEGVGGEFSTQAREFANMVAFGGSIANFNDAPERTQEEVVAKLREAAALAREQGK